MKRFKKILLISIVIISQLHVVFRGLNQRVDWFLFTDKPRGLNFSVFMLGVFIRFIIVHYCLLKPNDVNKNIALFLLVLSVLDLIHFFLTSGLGYAELKIVVAFIVYKIIKPYVKTC